MYACTLAFSYALAPASLSDNRRTIASTILFATAGIVGWPFALALAVPFVFEELFVFSADRVAPEVKRSWMAKRWIRLITAGLTAFVIFVSLVLPIESA